MFLSSLRWSVLKASASFITQTSSFRSPHRLLHRSPLVIYQPNTSLYKQLSISNQTKVSITIANHLFTNKFPNSNVVFSPFTIHFILMNIALGSKGRTLDQLLGFLKASSVDELKFFYSQLPNRKEIGPDDDGPDLGPKNTIAAYEKHSIGQVPSQVVHTTKGSWTVKFDCSKIEESEFNLVDGNKVQVPFITNNEKQYACDYNDFKVLRTPSMRHGEQKSIVYFLLPKEKDGIQSLIKKINSTTDFFDCHTPNQKVEMGKFLIPKFKFSFNFEASDTLKDLGLVLPFNAEAGLAEIVHWSDLYSIYVSSMSQEIAVEAIEDGVEPTEAFGCMEDEGSPKMDFVANHPFLFVVRNDLAKTVTLMGQVIDPSVG